MGTPSGMPLSPSVILTNDFPALSVRIVGGILSKPAAGTVRIVDAVRRVRAAKASVRIRDRVRVIGVGTQAATIVAARIVELWRLRSVGIGGAEIGVWASVPPIWILDTVRTIGISRTIGVGGRVGAIRVGAQVPQILVGQESR